MLTQIGTAVTYLWEVTVPIYPLLLWWRATADRPGRLRAFANRWRLDLAWIAIGAATHLGIALTMRLGILSWAMLALYPLFWAAHVGRRPPRARMG